MILIKTTINDIEVNYIKKGEGKKVLIIPGWGTTINTYMTLINSISTYREVYCLDMPGFGESKEPKSSWNLDDYINFIIDFIKDQKIQELDLIGHSNGGRIIIKMIGNKKVDFKVNKIILIGSAGIVHKPKTSQKLKVKFFKLGKKILGLKPVKKLFPDLLTKFKNSFGSEDYRNASAIMKESMVKLIHEDVRECLPQIKVPVLLLWGENDTATPIEDGELMEKMIPDAGLVKVAGCSHYVFLEQPAYINNIIKTFLTGGK